MHRRLTKGSLPLVGLLLDDDIRLTAGRLVSGGSGAAVLSSLLAAKSARTTDEHRALVLKHHFARVLVEGMHDRGNSRSLALVEHFHDRRLVDQRSAQRDRLLDRQVLLAVQEHHRAKIGQEVHGDTAAGHELGNDTPGGQSLEVVGLLVGEVELLLSCADTQVVKDDVTLRVGELGLGHGLLLGLLDDVRVLGATKVERSSAHEQLKHNPSTEKTIALTQSNHRHRQRPPPRPPRSPDQSWR